MTDIRWILWLLCFLLWVNSASHLTSAHNTPDDSANICDTTLISQDDYRGDIEIHPLTGESTHHSQQLENMHTAPNGMQTLRYDTRFNAYDPAYLGVQAPDEPVQVVYRSEERITKAVWSPDGSIINLWLMREYNPAYGLWHRQLDAETGDLLYERFDSHTGLGSGFQSPARRYVHNYDWQAEHAQTIFVDTTTGEQTILAGEIYSDNALGFDLFSTPLSWSQNDEWVLMLIHDDEHNRHIVPVSPSTGAAHPFVEPIPYTYNIFWSPHALWYTDNFSDSQSLYRVDLATGEIAEIQTDTRVQGVSPDGAWIFTHYRNPNDQEDIRLNALNFDLQQSILLPIPMSADGAYTSYRVLYSPNGACVALFLTHHSYQRLAILETENFTILHTQEYSVYNQTFYWRGSYASHRLVSGWSGLGA
ncbi:MAG: hypothetical protein AAFV98_11285 [Chloroflexota bacterium]